MTKDCTEDDNKLYLEHPDDEDINSDATSHRKILLRPHRGLGVYSLKNGKNEKYKNKIKKMNMMGTIKWVRVLQENIII